MVGRVSAAGHGEHKQFTTLVSYANTRARHTSYSVPVGKNSGCRPCFQVSSLPPQPQPRRTSPVSCSETENSGRGSTRSRTSSVKRTSTYGNIPENFVADPPQLSKGKDWCVLVHNLPIRRRSSDHLHALLLGNTPLRARIHHMQGAVSRCISLRLRSAE